jgi:hypothetical protein
VHKVYINDDQLSAAFGGVSNHPVDLIAGRAKGLLPRFVCLLVDVEPDKAMVDGLARSRTRRSGHPVEAQIFESQEIRTITCQKQEDRDSCAHQHVADEMATSGSRRMDTGTRVERYPDLPRPPRNRLSHESEKCLQSSAHAYLVALWTFCRFSVMLNKAIVAFVQSVFWFDRAA